MGETRTSRVWWKEDVRYKSVQRVLSETPARWGKGDLSCVHECMIRIWSLLRALSDLVVHVPSSCMFDSCARSMRACMSGQCTKFMNAVRQVSERLDKDSYSIVAVISRKLVCHLGPNSFLKGRARAQARGGLRRSCARAARALILRAWVPVFHSL